MQACFRSCCCIQLGVMIPPELCARTRIALILKDLIMRTKNQDLACLVTWWHEHLMREVMGTPHHQHITWCKQKAAVLMLWHQPYVRLLGTKGALTKYLRAHEKKERLLAWGLVSVTMVVNSMPNKDKSYANNPY